MDKTQPPIDFPAQPADTIQRARAAIARTKEAEDRVVRSTAIDDASFDNVLLPLILDENTRRCEERVLGLFASVHPSKGMRDASSEASRLFDDATVESFQREDISRLVDAVVQQNDPLDDESRHYLKKRHRKYLDYGLKMPAPARDRFAAVRKRISDLTRECQKNYNMDNSGLWINPQELAGVPDNVVGRFKKQDRQVWHPLKRADVTTTLQHAQNAESRKAILAATEKKCPENLALMKELFVLRHDMATSLGYMSYAAWQLEGSVAGSPENVSQFLDDLRDKLTPIAKADLSRLAGLKSQHPGQLHYWDFPYYRARLLKDDYDVDQDLVAEYFPFEVVLAGLLEMFRALYGIKMCPPSQPILTWHVDVTALEAWDEDGRFCGHLYLDLHPREFKRSASGHWRLNQGYEKPDGTRHFPSSAVIFNVRKPAPNEPTLMKHSEVVSLFNELGHAVRNLLTRVKFASSHSGYDTDFIVTPSKMLEHFLWDPRQIHWLSRHYSYLADQPSEKQRGKPEKMPDTLVKSLVSSRFSLGAIDTLQQAARSRFALTVHNQAMRADVEALDLTALYNSLRDDYSMLCGPDHHWAHAETTFNPVFSHWAAAHYSFLHSSAVGADLFESAFKHDPMSPHTGRRFRRVVLEPGGHKPQHLLLNEFLGRPPSNEAFIKGLTG